MRELRYYRLKSGMSQETLALKADVSQPVISNIETKGNIKCSKRKLDEIAEIVDFPHDSLKLADHHEYR